MSNEFEKIFDSIAASAVPEPQDYTDSETGLLFCGKCHTHKQCRVTLFRKEKLMPCTCRCRQEQIAAEGQGLLFWGGVGTGKTFTAACIANALTEQGIPVLMTNFSKILNSLSGMFSGDRNKYLASFGEFELLIIDDLGIERNSEYAQEQVYNVVDSRYLSPLPFIITTNLALAELKEPKDIAHARIYDRILERLAPVRFSGRNYRTENAENTKKVIREIFTQEDGL